MLKIKLFAMALLLLFVFNAVLYSENNEAADNKDDSAASVDLGAVAVKVNDFAITEGDIEAAIVQQLSSRPDIMKNEELFARYKQSLRRRVLSSLINSALLNQAAESEGLALTEEEINEKLDEIVKLGMQQTGMTREELAADILKNKKMTIEESLNLYKKNKQFLDVILFEKIVSAKFPKEAFVSENEIKEYYNKNLDARYKQKATVTASHILVTTLDEKRQPLSEEKKLEAKAKIEKIKKELSEPKADFGELAEKYSDCPSGKRAKGSLGAFPRHGAMVEPFAEAAFELEPGEISDIVETQFGYHIIKVTDKAEEKVTAFDEVKDGIANQLAKAKKQQVLSEYVQKLREKAQIIYTNTNDDPVEIMKQQEELKKQIESKQQEEENKKVASDDNNIKMIEKKLNSIKSNEKRNSNALESSRQLNLDNLSLNQKIEYYVSTNQPSSAAAIGKPAVKPLIAFLDNTNREFCVTAAKALCEIGDLEAVDSLDKFFNSSSLFNKSPALNFTAYHGYAKIFNALIGKNQYKNALESYGPNALLCAADQGHGDIVNELLLKNIDVNSIAPYSEYEFAYIVHDLSENGITLIGSQGKRLPIMNAADKGYNKIVQLLINNGANVNVKDENGITPLMFASANGHTDVVKLLIENDADLEAKATWVITEYEKLKFINDVTRVKTKTIEGVTSLILAVKNAHTDVVNLLLSKGADVNAKDANGKMVLDYAIESCNKDIIKLLKQFGVQE